MRTQTKLMVGIGTTIVTLVLAGPAQASTAADDQYRAVLGEQSGGGNVQGPGGLPFTGLNLMLVGGIGTALTAGGIVLRRTARRSAPQCAEQNNSRSEERFFGVLHFTGIRPFSRDGSGPAWRRTRMSRTGLSLALVCVDGPSGSGRGVCVDTT